MGFASPGSIAIAIGPIQLRWYGILLAGAAIIGLALAKQEAERRGEDLDAFLLTCCVAVAGGIVGARVYHVLFHWDYFSRSPLEVFALWEGGVGTFGGIFGSVLLVVIYTRWRGLPLNRYLDIMAPSAVLGQAIVRWGEFFNEEAFGRPTDLPWGLYISPAHRPPGFTAFEHFHPTFLYESLWCLGAFLIISFILRQRLAPVPGSLFLASLALYSLGRIPVEGLRLDSAMVGSYRAGQVAAGGWLLAAGVGIPWLWWRRHKVGLQGRV